MPGLIDAHVHLSSLDRSLGPELHPFGLVQAARRHAGAASRRSATSAASAARCSICGTRSSAGSYPGRGWCSAARSWPPARPVAARSPACTGRPTAPTRCARRYGSRSARAPTSSRSCRPGALTVVEEDVGPTQLTRAGDRCDRRGDAPSRLQGRLARRGLGRDPALGRGGRRHARARRDGFRGAGRSDRDGRARDHPRADPVRLRRRGARRMRPSCPGCASEPSACASPRARRWRSRWRPACRWRWEPTPDRTARTPASSSSWSRPGMSASDGIVAATSTAARACGLEDEIGTVEVGKRADLLVVDGDPLEDVRDRRRPRSDLARAEGRGAGCGLGSRPTYTWSRGILTLTALACTRVPPS